MGGVLLLGSVWGRPGGHCLALVVAAVAALATLVAPRIAGAQEDLACDRGAPEVRRIIVTGAVEPSEGEVRTATASEATSWWRRTTRLPFGARHCLDSLELARDRERLRALHLQHGLFRARTSYVVRALATTVVEVEFTIVEGPRTRLDSVHVRGLDSIPSVRSASAEMLHRFEGEAFNEPELLAAVDSLQDSSRNSALRARSRRSFISCATRCTIGPGSMSGTGRAGAW